MKPFLGAVAIATLVFVAPQFGLLVLIMYLFLSKPVRKKGQRVRFR